MESIPATYKFLYGVPSKSVKGGSTINILLLGLGIALTVFKESVSDLSHIKAVGTGFIPIL